jgi:hypothetical protein
MSRRRRVVVELTEDQFSALAGAVAERTASLEDLGDYEFELELLEAAWSRLRDAWHGVTK